MLARESVYGGNRYTAVVNGLMEAVFSNEKQTCARVKGSVKTHKVGVLRRFNLRWQRGYRSSSATGLICLFAEGFLFGEN